MDGQAKAPQMAGDGQPQWQRAMDLLASGQYSDAADLLEDTEAVARANDDPDLTVVLQAAREICLAGNEVRADVHHHEKAYRAATQREEQLRQHLHALLNVIAARSGAPNQEVSSGPLPSPSSGQESQIPGLLKRLQSLLGRSNHTKSSPDDGTLSSVADSEPEQPQEPRLLSATTPTTSRSTNSRSPDAPYLHPDVGTTHHKPSLAVYCLGPLAVYQNDRLITDWNGLKGLTILKYMASQRGKPIAKEVLMEVVWPGADPEAARRNLHQAIYSLRQTLRRAEPDFQHIPFHKETYSFNPRINVWIDFVQFERYVKEGQRREKEGNARDALHAFAIAEELYQGNFLEEDPYEEWAIGIRERVRNYYLEIADRLTEHYLKRKEYAAVTALCHKALAQDSCYEVAHRRLMECYVAQGQRHLAVRQYQFCARLLAEELDLEPSSETEAIYRKTISNG